MGKIGADLLAGMIGNSLTFMPHVPNSPHRPTRRLFWPVLVVVALGAIVHPAGVVTSTWAASRSKPEATNDSLPIATGEMRDAILAAVHSGKVIELKTALELNEMRPDIADGPVDDPIAYFKTLSKDGEGHEILGVLGKILSVRPAVVPFGRDIENNAIYVWPYFAERDLSALTVQEEAELAALMPPEDIAAIKAAKRWAWWRLAIGADGTWHSFRREK